MTSAQYMLDTNTVIYLRDGRIPRTRMVRSLPGSLVMSIVTYGELHYGAKKSKRKHALGLLELIIAGIPTLPMGEAAAEVYGDLRAELEARGQTIGSNDTWIAAHALSTKLILVTNNEREFRRVKGLKIENWLS